jgi:RNA polymerase sigma-B factor
MAMPDGQVPEAHHRGDEEVERLLEALARAGDEAERRRLRAAVVQRMIGLADAIAHRHLGWGLDREDLEQVARTALVAAVDRYRVGRGRGFVAFAVPTITGELKRHFRDLAWVVRPPRPVQERRARLRSAEDELRQRRAGEVSAAELARVLGCGVDEVREVWSCAGGLHPVSLESPARFGGTVGESVPDSHDDYGALDVHTVLMDLVRGLPDRDRLLLRLRFVEERSQREIGELIGVSQVQVSRLLSRIVAELREGLELPAA